MQLPKALQPLVHPLGIAAGFAVAVVALILAIIYMRVALFVWAAVFLAAAVIGLVSGAVAEPGGSISGPKVEAKYKYVPDWAVYVVGVLFAIAIVVTIIWPPIP